jgi:hypothetical protein
MKQVAAAAQQEVQEGIRECIKLVLQLPTAGVSNGSATNAEKLSADQVLGIHRLSG